MSNLQSHQRQHMKGKPHRCENCFMSYDTKEDLDLHVQAKHAGNRYAKVLVCPACSKSYNSETYLSKHMERHKEAVTNSSVGRLGLNSSGALGALSGFVNPGRGRSGSTGDLHDEIQHYPELHHLQHAAAAAAAASFMPHSESSLLHHLPPGLQGQNAAHLVAAAAAHKSEQQAGQQGHHTAGGGGLIEQSQHHVSPSSSSSGRMSVGHTPYPQQQQQQHHQHHHQQILAAAAASHHLASSYAGTGQMPAFLNKPPSLEECMNAEELVASGLRHVARFSDSKTGFQSLAAAAVVTSPTPQPPPIAHQQTRGGQMIGDPSPRQQDNFQQYCRSPAEDQHHPQQHTDSADSLDGRSQSPGFRGPPKETGIGDKRVRKPPLEAWEQHVVSGGQMPESARINSMESSATGTVTGSTSSHLGADEAVGCRSLGFYSHLSAAKRLKPDPDELEEEEDNPRHLTVSDQKDCSRAGKRISLDESSAVSGGSSSSSSNHQRNFGTEFLRRSAPNSASSCTADTLFHSRSHQEYNPQRQQQQHHHHPQQQQQQQHQMTNLPQETMTHTVENVVDKLAKFFPLVGAGGADKRNVNTSVRDLRIEALLAGFQGQAQDARGVLPGTNDEEDEDDEADEEEEEEEIEEERRTKLSTGHLAHASRTDKGSGSQLSSSYRSESVSTTAKIPAVASSPSMEDFRTSSQQPVGQSARAFMEEDIRNERSHGSVQKVPGSINFVQRQSSVVGGSPSPVPPSSSPVYSTEESRYGRGLQNQANGQFFQRSGFFESSKLSDTGSGSQTYDPTNSTPSTPPPPTTKESDENSFCEALGHRHVPFGHSGKLGLTVHGSPLARDLSGKSAESSLEEQQQQQDQQQQQSRSRGGINFLSFPDQ
nr:unnamed protein product [Spirometra erinaceieuropaei]